MICMVGTWYSSQSFHDDSEDGKKEIAEKEGAPYGSHRVIQAGRDYKAFMAGLGAKSLVFLVESLFNETTGWRLTAWTPIGIRTGAGQE